MDPASLRLLRMHPEWEILRKELPPVTGGWILNPNPGAA
jgi:hypothetical protein